jgi:hypothetical protein
VFLFYSNTTLFVKDCSGINVDTKIHFKMVFSEPEIDKSLSIAELTQKHAKLYGSNIPKHMKTFGLAAYKERPHYSAGFKIKPIGLSGNVCLVPTHLNFTLYSMRTIYINREAASSSNTLDFEKTLEHEVAHLKVHRDTLKSYEVRLKDSLNQAVTHYTETFGSGPFPASDVNKLKEAFYEYANTYVMILGKEYQEELSINQLEVHKERRL